MRFFEKLVVAYFFGPPCIQGACWTTQYILASRLQHHHHHHQRQQQQVQQQHKLNIVTTDSKNMIMCQLLPQQLPISATKLRYIIFILLLLYYIYITQRDRSLCGFHKIRH